MSSTYFGLVMFLALVALAKWKQRRDQVARMNRGLSSYVTTQKTPSAEEGACPHADVVEAA